MWTGNLLLCRNDGPVKLEGQKLPQPFISIDGFMTYERVMALKMIVYHPRSK